MEDDPELQKGMQSGPHLDGSLVGPWAEDPAELYLDSWPKEMARYKRQAMEILYTAVDPQPWGLQATRAGRAPPALPTLSGVSQAMVPRPLITI